MTGKRLHLKANVARREARARRAAADFRTLNYHMIGYKAPNAGPGLTVGSEWETSDGFRVRQVTAEENPREAGHFTGTVEVIAFGERYAEKGRNKP